MGAVLTQLTEQGEEHPILYLSKKFSEVEKRYCTTEKECASIVFAIKRLHYYLDVNSFLVMTDHNPLVWLNRNVSSNPRLMLWSLALQPYNFRIVHRSGRVVSSNSYDCCTPVCHGCDEVIDQTLGNTVPLLKKCNPKSRTVAGGLGRAAIVRACPKHARLGSGQDRTLVIPYAVLFQLQACSPPDEL
ncbi:transposon Tf2-9 polyprotein [Trichonephila clavipes]|nr:transposon Tf2-9 polyprotein [Trichonephila clavipes]